MHSEIKAEKKSFLSLSPSAVFAPFSSLTQKTSFDKKDKCERKE